MMLGSITGKARSRCRWLSLPSVLLGATAGWGVYLAVTLALGLVLSPTGARLDLVSTDLSHRRTAIGVSEVIGGLRPGLEATIVFGSSGGNDTIFLSGHKIDYTQGEGMAYLSTPWILPNKTLFPGEAYAVWLEQEFVGVRDHGRG